MGRTTTIFWFILLVTQEIKSTPLNAVEDVTATIDTIAALQNQLNHILVQFCASEIDRNKTASAISKFGQLADPNASIENIVEFYIENYVENFDNLLNFIDHTSSLELQQKAYDTLVDAMKLNHINVVNLLSFENFIRTKLRLLDGDHSIVLKTYENILLTIDSHVKELVSSTDLNRMLMFINKSSNPDRIFELIPRIIQGIDLNNFTDMNRIFAFSMQLPKINQINLISQVLSEMRNKNQFKHVFHVVIQLNIMRNQFNSGEYLIEGLEKLVPKELQELISSRNLLLRIKHFNSGEFESKYLTWLTSPKYSKNILITSSSEAKNIWYLSGQRYNSLAIGSTYNYQFLSVDYCFHNDSFPISKQHDESDPYQLNWYIFMSEDLTYVQIKNLYTNELLVADTIRELASEQASDLRVTLSANCLDCDESKWSLVSVGRTQDLTS